MANEAEIGIGLGALLLLLFSGGGDDEATDVPSRGPDDEPDEDDIVPVNIIPGVLEPDEPDEDDIVPVNIIPGILEPDEEKGDDKGPPWGPAIYDEYPTPRAFYKVRTGDTGYGIAYKYLRSVGFLAAKQFGKLDDAAANAWAKNAAKNVQLQKKVWRALSCIGFNDATVTTYGWKGTSQPLAPTGRVIRLLPQHANNAARLANGQPPIRNIKWGNPSMKGKGGGVGVNGSMRNFELLWMPGAALKRYWESGGTDLVFGGGEWGNSGVGYEHPPPWVLELGVQYEPGSMPGGVNVFGCDGLELE